MVSITLKKTCGRCHRPNDVEYSDVDAAKNEEGREKVKEAVAKELSEFVAAKADVMPDLVVILDGEIVISHAFLCENGGPKSNCSKRVLELLGQIKPLAPRKPRSKKANSAADDSAADA